MNFETKKRTLFPATSTNSMMTSSASKYSATVILTPLEVAKILDSAPTKVLNPSLKKLSETDSKETS